MCSCRHNPFLKFRSLEHYMYQFQPMCIKFCVLWRFLNSVPVKKQKSSSQYPRTPWTNCLCTLLPTLFSSFPWPSSICRHWQPPVCLPFVKFCNLVLKRIWWIPLPLTSKRQAQCKCFSLKSLLPTLSLWSLLRQSRGMYLRTELLSNWIECLAWDST